MARQLANLRLAQITQDFLPEHWKDWTDEEKKHLGNVEQMGKIMWNITVKTMNLG